MRLNWYFKAKCKEFLRCMAKNASPKWKCTPKHTFDVNAEQTFNLQNKRNIFVRPNGKKKQIQFISNCIEARILPVNRVTHVRNYQLAISTELNISAFTYKSSILLCVNSFFVRRVNFVVSRNTRI